jgi:hypothetical protein
MLAEIWRRAFGMDCVGITDNYEDLGGDSLLAASIFVELGSRGLCWRRQQRLNNWPSRSMSCNSDDNSKNEMMATGN